MLPRCLSGEEWRVDRLPGLTPEQLALRISDYDGLAIRSATKVTKQIILEARNLKVIGSSRNWR